MKAYIVCGHTGEYDDYHEWNVAVYTDEALAEKHVELLERAIQEISNRSNRTARDLGYVLAFSLGKTRLCPLDPDMSIDYTGVHWGVQEVELLDCAPVMPQGWVDWAVEEVTKNG